MFCFELHYQIGGDIIKEALKRVNVNRNDGSSDIEMIRNQVVKIGNSNDSMQQQIYSIEKSIEKLLEFQKNVKLVKV